MEQQIMKLLPNVSFLGKKLTRMIVGDNPQTGHSYIEDRVTGEEMKTFYTAEKILETLFTIQDAGYNAILPLSNPSNLQVLKEFRRLGGNLEIIFQPYTAESLEENLPKMLELEPFAIYHQGTTTDYLSETEGWEKLHKNLALLRSAKVKVGLGTHVPETVIRAEREGWDTDFYVLCMYNARRNREGEQSGFITGKSKSGLIFRPDDRFDAYKVIQQVQKPFVAFKILAGGQIFAGHADEEYPAITEKFVRETFDNIKPGDITCVGVFQRDGDQARENAAIVRRVLAV